MFLNSNHFPFCVAINLNNKTSFDETGYFLLKSVGCKTVFIMMQETLNMFYSTFFGPIRNIKGFCLLKKNSEQYLINTFVNILLIDE